jgi:hypothetical protein
LTGRAADWEWRVAGPWTLCYIATVLPHITLKEHSSMAYVATWLHLRMDRRAVTKPEYGLIVAIIGVTFLGWWMLSSDVHPGSR